MEGRAFEAQQIRSLCLSAEALRETCNRLYQDNQALRRAKVPADA